MPLPEVHLLTCAARISTCAQTLARWARTDWPGSPHVYVGAGTDEAWGRFTRTDRRRDAFAAMVRSALVKPGEEQQWLLFLDDDLDFHPHLASHLEAWEPLRDRRSGMASVFNPSVRAATNLKPLRNSFAAEPQSFVAEQALLLRRCAAKQAVAHWNERPSLTSQRLNCVLQKWQPFWVHKPSLVQKVGPDSEKADQRPHAPDFDPDWVPL